MVTSKQGIDGQWLLLNSRPVNPTRMFLHGLHRFLQCSSVFIIQSTEIILSQAEIPGFQLSIVIVFVKFEERFGKYESNENSRSKSHIFTVRSLLRIC